VIAEERHLLASDAVLVQAAVEDHRDTVGNQNGYQDGQEKGN